jgi:glycosyltransferase involved in cell wall biosynthesis
MNGSRETRIIVGTIPPPFGGVTVYVDRCIREWRKNESLDVIHVPPRSIGRLLWLCLCKRTAEFHVNTLHPLVLFLLLVTGSCPQTVLYDHNHSWHLQPGSLIARFVFAVARRTQRIEVANRKLTTIYRDIGIPEDRIAVFLPFIPPDAAEEHALFATLPERVRRLACDPAIRLVINSAWKLVQTSAGTDLYGFDTTTAVARRIAPERPDLHFLFFLGLAPEDAHARRIVDDISGLPNATLIVGNHILWPVLRHAAAFLRTTATDGDSVAVREALYFGTPVIASNAAERPDGVILYAYGDDDDLYRCLMTSPAVRHAH